MKTTGACVGRNLRRIREEHGHTQEATSRLLKQHGINWTQARISQIEAGRVQAISLNAIVLLSLAYQVKPEEWFKGCGRVRIAPETIVDSTFIQEVLRGEYADVSGLGTIDA